MSDIPGAHDNLLFGEDFDWDVLQSVIADCAPADYYKMHIILRSSSANEKLAERERSIFRILSDICFLRFEPVSRNRPYTPIIQLGDSRSFSLDDLVPADLTLLEAVVPRVIRPDLRGRIWDVLWLKQRNLGVYTALSAIEAYSAVRLPASPLHRSQLVVNCWERALSLARMIRSAGDTAIEPLETVISGALNQALNRALTEDDTLALELSSISIRYGLDTDRRDERSQALNAIAATFRDNGLHYAEREFLEAAARWKADKQRGEAYWTLVIGIAESHELDAKREAESTKPSYLRVATILEQAIQQYRRVPRQFRPLGFEVRLAELQQRLLEAGALAVEQMSIIQSGPIDLSEMAEGAKARVSGRSVFGALIGLITLFPIPTRAELLNGEREMIAQGSSIFPQSTFHDDGRVIAKAPASSPENDESVLIIRAIENYARRIELVVKGAIIPGLETLNCEHCIGERELLQIVAHSAAVPPGREAFFAKGLAAGFDWDFMNSSHLLIPQLEAFLRYHIKARGGDTTVLSPEGIHAEASLRTLLEMELATDILGPDMVFLFDAFLVNPHGPNFRNVQAHGLIDESAAGGVHSVFVWWLCLYLVVFPFWANGKGRSGTESAD